MHYDNISLCMFFKAGLNQRTKVHLPGEGPRGMFLEFVEWVLHQCGSPYTIEETEEDQDPLH